MTQFAKIGGDIPRRVSYNKKISNDFARQKEIVDVFDLYYGDFRDQAEISKYNINYELLNGRLDTKLYDEPICLNIESEKIKFDFQSITHYPLISQIANAMYGEMINRPFQPIAKDLGSFATTVRNKKWNELLKEFVNVQILQPIRDEVTQIYFQQNNIQNLYNLNPQQQQQVEADIQRRIVEKTPKEILDFMQNDFQTPTQRQAQQLLDYFIVHQDIKWKQDEGFKHSLPTGKEVYYIGDRHGEPIFELCNPKYFTWGGSQNTEWYQHGHWVKYEQWLSIEEATQKHAEHLRPKDYRELEGFAEPIGGLRSVGDPEKDFIQNRVMYEVSLEDGYFARKYGDINYKTKLGQNKLVDLYADIIKKYGKNYGYAFGNYGIREAHFAWKDKTKLKRVTRIINGQEKKFWLDEHYEERPEDIEIVDIWVDEVWEATKIGSTGNDDIYVNIRPIPGQFKSLYNPFEVELPYYGRSYNTHMNNAKNVSMIDLGKPWQKEFDTTMAQIKHSMATDVGRVFFTLMDFKPEGWTWEQWLNTMRNSKLLIAQLKKHGYSGVDPQFLKGVDLSNSTDIADKIGLLDYYRRNLVQAMNFNDTRIGSIGEYTTNQNIQQSQSASYNQTEGYFETHRKIVEKALNAFMNRAKFIYRNNNKTKFIFDDITRTEFEVSPEFWYEAWAVEFTTNSEDIKRTETLRAEMFNFIQNGMSFDGILALALAKTPSDIIDIMKKENKRAEEIRQQNIQIQQEQSQKELDAKYADLQADRESKERIKLAEMQSGLERTLIDSEKFRKQADVNANNQADSIEKSKMELEVKKLLEERKLDLEKQKHDDDIDIEKEKLEIEKKKVEKTGSKK